MKEKFAKTTRMCSGTVFSRSICAQCRPSHDHSKTRPVDAYFVSFVHLNKYPFTADWHRAHFLPFNCPNEKLVLPTVACALCPSFRTPEQPTFQPPLWLGLRKTCHMCARINAHSSNESLLCVLRMPHYIQLQRWSESNSLGLFACQDI